MSRDLRGAQGNRLVASEMGQPGRPVLLLHGGGQTRHAWSRTARRLAEARLACGRARPARPWRQRVGGGRGLRVSRLRGRRDRGRPPDRTRARRQARRDRRLARRHRFAPGARRAGRSRSFAGPVLVDVVPRMDPRGVDHIQGFMRARAGEGFALDRGGRRGGRRLPAAPSEAGLPRRAEEEPPPPPGRPLALALGPALPRRPALGECRLGPPWSRRLLEAATAHCRVPTLLVRGGSSELVTPEAAAEFLWLAPAAEYVDVADARHMVAGDRNDVFADAILPSCGPRSARHCDASVA